MENISRYTEYASTDYVDSKTKTFTTFEVLEGYTYIPTTGGSNTGYYCEGVTIPYNRYDKWTLEEKEYFYNDAFFEYDLENNPSATFTYIDGTVRTIALCPYNRGIGNDRIPGFMADYEVLEPGDLLAGFYIELFGTMNSTDVQDTVAISMNDDANANPQSLFTSIKITVPEMKVTASIAGKIAYNNGGGSSAGIVMLTQEEYDALTEIDENVLYIIG